MTTSARWAWIIAIVAATGAALVLAFVLSFSSQGGGFYERHFVWLFGVNVAVAVLPPWMQSVSQVLPLTHGIEAARELAGGRSLADVAPLVRDEVVIGIVFAAIGFAMLLWMERESRRHASLELA